MTMAAATTTTTHYSISEPTGVPGQVRLEAGTIERTTSPTAVPAQPQPAVLPTAHTHAPAEEVDSKVLKARKEQQKQLEKELEREEKLDAKEIEERKKEIKDVEKQDEKVEKAEDKARKHYEKVKAKYEDALKDLRQAEAELNEKIHERQALAQQHKLAEMRVSEQIQAKQVHDAAREQAIAQGPAAGL